MKDKKVVIAGAGISGLATAYFLEQKGFSNISVIEADTSGGKINTLHEEGYIVELGPDSFLIKPDIMELVRQLGMEQELVKPVSSHFSIYTTDKMIAVPAGLASFVPNDIFAFLKSPLLSISGKLRLMLEPFIPKRKSTGDESLESFITRRFGRETLLKLAAPLFSGVYATPAAHLSVQATFPQFRQMELQSGSITRAVLLQRGKNKTPGGSPFRSFRKGMDIFPKTLKNKLKSTNIIENCALVSIQYNNKWQLSTNRGTQEADILIMAIPANRASGLFRKIHPSLSLLLDRISFNSTRVITFAFDEKSLPELPAGTGFLIPAKEQGQITACTYLDQKWEGRAPKGKKLLRCFLQYTPEANEVPDPMGENVLKELKKYIRIEGKPEKAWQKAYAFAQPSYMVGHADLVKNIEHTASGFNGLYFTGTSYRGIGLPDCVKQAKELAELLDVK